MKRVSELRGVVNKIFNESEGDQIYRRVQSVTGPGAWDDLKRLLLTVAAGDQSLYFTLEDAINRHSREALEAAFVVGAVDEMGLAIKVLMAE